jgi:hypothetical protein
MNVLTNPASYSLRNTSLNDALNRRLICRRRSHRSSWRSISHNGGIKVQQIKSTDFQGHGNGQQGRSNDSGETDSCSARQSVLHNLTVYTTMAAGIRGCKSGCGIRLTNLQVYRQCWCWAGPSQASKPIRGLPASNGAHRGGLPVP